MSRPAVTYDQALANAITAAQRAELCLPRTGEPSRYQLELIEGLTSLARAWVAIADQLVIHDIHQEDHP